MSKPRLAVLGAGPVGLEAALHARKLGLAVTVYERGRVGEHVRRWGHVRTFSPFALLSTRVGRDALRAARVELPADDAPLTGHEFADRYLAPLARLPELHDAVRTETTVAAVGATSSRGFRLLLRDAQGADGEAWADAVLDCTGTYARPRFLGDGGIPALGEVAAHPHIVRSVADILGADRERHANRTTLVVGAGATAATHVAALAELAESAPATWTVWLARAPRSAPLPRSANDPLRERDRLFRRANELATRGEGHVEFHANAVVERVDSHGPDKGFRVTARVGGRSRTWEVDRVLASVGYTVGEGFAAAAGHPKFAVLGARERGGAEFLLADGLARIPGVVARVAG